MVIGLCRGDARDRRIDICHEIDAVDIRRAGGGGQTEDGPAHANIGVGRGRDVGGDAAARHVPRDDLIVEAVHRDRLGHGGLHLRALVAAIEPPQVGGPGGKTEVAAHDHEVFLRRRDIIVEIVIVEHQAHVVGSRPVHGDDIRHGIILDIVCREACPVAGNPVVGHEPIFVVGISAHEPEIIDARAEGGGRCREPHDKLRFGPSLCVDGKRGGNGILHVVEAADRPFDRLGDGDVGNLHAVDREGTHAPGIGGGESAENREAVFHAAGVEERILDIAVGLGIAIGLIHIAARGGV